MFIPNLFNPFSNTVSVDMNNVTWHEIFRLQMKEYLHRTMKCSSNNHLWPTSHKTASTCLAGSCLQVFTAQTSHSFKIHLMLHYCVALLLPGRLRPLGTNNVCHAYSNSPTNPKVRGISEQSWQILAQLVQECGCFTPGLWASAGKTSWDW